MVQQSKKAPKLLGHYEKGYKNNSFNQITEVEAYEIIRTQNAETTQYIQTKFKKGITEGWNDNKTEYQTAKANSFDNTTFSISTPRRRGADVSHTNIICLDLDDNTVEELREFRALILEGGVDFARASALSVSGLYNGSFWLNVGIDVTNANYESHTALYELLKLNAESTQTEVHTKLHAAYNELMEHELSKFGIVVPSSSKTLKQPRYLSHDKDIYVNLEARTFTLEDLYNYQKVNIPKKQKRVSEYAKNRINSDATIESGLDLCREYATFKLVEEYDTDDLTEHKRMSAFNFGVKANLLGINKEEALDYLISLIGVDGVLNESYIEQLYSPYITYADAFGVNGFELEKFEKKDENFIRVNLDKGERLSSKGDLIDKALVKYKKLSLEAQTSIGKNYASIHEFSKRFKQRTGGKTIIVLSLNMKVLKDYEQYGDQSITYVTGERIKADNGFGAIKQNIIDSDIILCNYNQYSKVVSLITQSNEEGLGCEVLTIIDEVQTIGKAYKESVSRDLWSALNRYSSESILMTGTPLDYFETLGFKRVKVYSYHDPINMEVRVSSKNPAFDVMSCLDQFPNDVLLVKYNSKQGIEDLKKNLISLGVKEKSIICIYSGNSKEEKAKYEKQLNSDKRNSFANHIRVVLCTSAINEGVDVFGKDRNITTINIEKTGYFNPSELVQYADRYRSGKAKDLICYFNNLTNPAQGFLEFNAEKEFKSLVEDYQIDVDSYNLRKDSEIYRKSSMMDFKNRFARDSKFAFYNDSTQQYEVDVIAIMVEVQEAYMKKCTALEGLRFIKDKYDYFNISFNDAQADISDEDLQTIKDAEKVAKMEKEDVKKELVKLYKEDKETLLKAIALHFKDEPKYKDYKLGFGEDLDDYIKEHKVLFTGQFIRIAKSILDKEVALDYYKFSDSEKTEIILIEEGAKFVNDNKFRVFVNCLDSRLQEYIFTIYKHNPESALFNVVQRFDAERMHLFATNDLFDMFVEYQQSELMEIVNNWFSGKKGRKREFGKAQTMGLINAFFEVEVKGCKYHKKSYQIGANISIADFLRNSGLENPAEFIDRFTNEYIERS
jgi:hypothetical protein